jgi:hypothetical protein
MAMGTRKQRAKQEGLWIAHTELASAPGHPFYLRLNEVLEAEGFDEFVESRCAKFYAAKYGRPSLTPGIYFRALLIGYFEGMGAERGIAWRLADSLALRRFVGIALDEYTPDHSTISRTRRLIDLDTHREVFGWVLAAHAEGAAARLAEKRKPAWRLLQRCTVRCEDPAGLVMPVSCDGEWPLSPARRSQHWTQNRGWNRAYTARGDETRAVYASCTARTTWTPSLDGGGAGIAERNRRGLTTHRSNISKRTSRVGEGSGFKSRRRQRGTGHIQQHRPHLFEILNIKSHQPLP